MSANYTSIAPVLQTSDRGLNRNRELGEGTSASL
jgi:hypothetical protein